MMTPGFLPARIGPSLSAFLRDESGSISMQFIIWFPTLLFTLLGSFILFDVFYIASRHAKVTYTIADLMSRYSTVDDTVMNEIAVLHDKMLPPRTGRHGLRISSVCYAGGTHTVLWSYARYSVDADPIFELTATTLNTAVLPTMEEQDSLILVETMTRWTPISTYVGISPKSYSNELAIRPRFVNYIPYPSKNAATLCPTGSTPAI